MGTEGSFGSPSIDVDVRVKHFDALQQNEVGYSFLLG